MEQLWKIEKIIHKGDYLYAKVQNHPNATKNNYVLLHRVIMENHIGRLLLDNEIVHHLDGNKHNNDIKNLQLLSNIEHKKLHGKERYPNGKSILTFICGYCGKEFLRVGTQRPSLKGYKNTYCTKECYYNSLRK